MSLNTALFPVDDYDPTFSEAVDITAELLRGLRLKRIGFWTAVAYSRKAAILRDQEITDREQKRKEIKIRMLQKLLPLQECDDLRGDDLRGDNSINGNGHSLSRCPAGMVECAREKSGCLNGKCELDFLPPKFFSDGHSVRFDRVPNPVYRSKRTRFRDQVIHMQDSIASLPPS